MEILTETKSKRSSARLTVEISDEHYEVLRYYLPHGMQKILFNIIIKDVVEMLETYGQHFLVAMLQKAAGYDYMMEGYLRRNGIYSSPKSNSVVNEPDEGC